MDSLQSKYKIHKEMTYTNLHTVVIFRESGGGAETTSNIHNFISLKKNDLK